MDYGKKFEQIVEETRQYFQKAHSENAVIGVSGGVDSALTLLILKKSIGAGNIIALNLPNKKISTGQNTVDAIEWCEKLGVKCIVQQIDKFVDEFKKTQWEPDEYAEMNLNARTRMVLLYSYANTHKALVVGTGNKTELALGYFTKYGDGGVDLSPLGALYKTHVWEMARAMGVPKKIIDKKPSAELALNHFDEDEIGMDYRKIDKLLEAIKKGAKAKDLEREFGKENAENILERIKKNRHKTLLPSIMGGKDR